MGNKNNRGSDFRVFLREHGILGEVESRASALHTRWVMEAAQSGSVKPLRATDMDSAFELGIVRAKTRKKEK